MESGVEMDIQDVRFQIESFFISENRNKANK